MKPLWRDNVLGRIVANAAILGAGKGANALFSLAYLALAARALGLETLGLLVLIHAYAQAVAEIAKLRSWEAVLRYGTPALQNRETGAFQALIKFTAALDAGSAVAAAVLAVVGSGAAASLLDWPAELRPAATLYCVSVIFMTPATPTGLLRLFGRFDLLAVQSTVNSFVRLIGSTILLLLGGGLVAFLAVWFLATLCASAALMAFAWREMTRRGLLGGIDRSLRGVTAPYTGIWRFVWMTNINSSVGTVSNQLPTLLVGGLLGAGAAALFRVARELAEALAKPTKLLVPTIFPELARLVATGSVRALRDLVWRSLVLAGAAGLACFLAIWLLGELLLYVVVGEAAAPAYGLMLLLGAAALVTLWAFPLEPLLISVGLEAAALRARLAATLVHLVLVATLTPAVGLIGAGMAAVAAALLMVSAQSVPAMRWLAGNREHPVRVAESGHFSDRGLKRHDPLAPLERGQ